VRLVATAESDGGRPANSTYHVMARASARRTMPRLCERKSCRMARRGLNEHPVLNSSHEAVTRRWQAPPCY